jgi:hypothetical protein
VEGEIIDYVIKVTNDDVNIISETIVYDALADTVSGEIASIENFYPMDSRTYPMQYKVKGTDIPYGVVIGQAWAEYTLDVGGTDTAYSELMVCPVGEEKNTGKKNGGIHNGGSYAGTPQTVETVPAPADGPEYCSKELKGSGIGLMTYEQTYCAEHMQTEDKERSILLDVSTQEEELAAWNEIAGLWDEDLAELEATLQANAPEAEKEFFEKDGLLVLVKYLKDQKRESLVKISDALKANKDNYLIVLIGEENGGYPIVVVASKKANDKGYLAGKIVRDISALLGGSGGGRPDIANGAGKDISKLNEVEKMFKC